MKTEDPGIRWLRVVLPLLMTVHAFARIFLGIVDDFGVFLDGVGFPFGSVLAWAITLWELVGGALLLSRRFVVSVCLVFALQLSAGIALVHWKEGWFVVGAGRNGMEYSVLLVVGFLAVALSERSAGP